MVTVETLEKKRKRLQGTIASLEQDVLSPNFEIKQGSKVFLRDAQESLEITDLAIEALKART